MPEPSYVNLHTHSDYSLLDGLAKVEALVNRAKELKMPALALTDHGVLYGAIDFYKTAKKAGIKPIIGMEAYLAPRSRFDKVTKIDSQYFHLTLLARNLSGYQNLIELSTAGWLEGFYYKPRIDRELLAKHADGLLILTGCGNSATSRAILDGKLEEAEKLIGFYQEIVGKDYVFLELQDHPNLPEQGRINAGLKDLAKKHGWLLVATCDSHYVQRTDKDAHEVLLAVQSKSMDEDKRWSLKEVDLYLRPPEEMAQAFSDVPEALENTLKVAELCDLAISFGEPHLPEYLSESGLAPAEELARICQLGLKQRYPAGVEDKIKQRLDYELQVINTMGFASYFLIVADVVNWAKSNAILVGPGRGSAAGSMVAYLTEVTELDPIAYGLLFERFLNPDRVSMPDIDIDFADTDRPKVLEYIRNKYGDDHVAGIITFGTMAARAAVRDTGRAIGMSYQEVDRIAKLIPPPKQGRHVPIPKLLAETPELRQVYEQESEAKRLLDLAARLEGTYRHAGQHASAIIISKEPLTKTVPLQPAQKGDVAHITQYSMYPVDELGLLKMDFLGLSNLSIIQRAVEIIEAVHKTKIEIDKLPLNDPKAYQLLADGETTGVFQLECLSGDTIISNTTLAKFFEKQPKTSLRSVYLNSGKIHNNRVLKIVQSGIKPVFTLIADNGWCIKASAQHEFLTDHGWKKLSQLNQNDKILSKKRARHLLFKTCETCGKQIDGQKDGRSRFCYRCSATYYSNPSKPLSRKKISASRLRFYERGGKPWNSGLTATTSVLIKQTGQKISQALTGRSFEDLAGPERARERRQRLSIRSLGANNPMFGKPSPHRKGGYRADLGHYVRSTWEADFARILCYLQIPYEYEPRTFLLTDNDGTVLHYTPDFFTPHNQTFYEIKGWLHDLDAKKIRLFQEQYSQYSFELINQTRMAEFALRYKRLVAWECPKIPDSCNWVSIREIRPAGEEMTYDIVMEAPGNNFVANGFIVHNSSGMKRYLKELQPSTLEDIIAMVALYRPGPLQFIDRFISRKHGREPVSFAHPLQENALKSTYGLMVYQEQVMQMAKEMAGLTGGQADTLRKAIGKKIPKLMAEQKTLFVEGCVKNGVEQSLAEKIFSQIEEFAAYSFNRSHAACYALIAYQTAYLKAHYPSEFMAALMTADHGDLDRLAIEIEECRRMGIEVLAPDVNESFVDFGVVREKDCIRFGLAGMKNIGQGVAQAIVKERKARGPYADLLSFLERLGPEVLNKKVLESLAKAGALDRFGERNQLLSGLDAMLKVISASKQSSQQIGLFEVGGPVGPVEISLTLPQVEPADQRQRLSWEKELLGMFLSDHPLKAVEQLLQTYATPIGQLAEGQVGQRIRVGGVIITTKKIQTKKDKSTMLFGTLEDLSSSIEFIAFPKILEQHQDLLRPDQLVLIEGRLSSRDADLKVVADKVWLLSEELFNLNLPAIGQGEVIKTLTTSPRYTLVVTLPNHADKGLLEQMKTVIGRYPGRTPVVLRVRQNGGFRELATKSQVDLEMPVENELRGLIGRDQVLLRSEN